MTKPPAERRDGPPPLVWIRAGAVRDAAGIDARPGSVAFGRGGSIVAAGDPARIEDVVRRCTSEGCGVEVLDLPGHLVLPAFANAHAHLDLTLLGPTPYTGSFASWAETVVQGRPSTLEATRAAIEEGLRKSRDAGVAWLGDIAGSDDAARARCEAPDELRIDGISWLECFGIGRSSPAAAARARAWIARADASYGRHAPEVGLCLQPHAPYSAGLALYEASCERAPSTHLAETPEEELFVRHGHGPFADMLRRFDGWDATLAGGTGKSPIEHLAPVLRKAPWTVAHVNYASDEDLDRLAACPDLTVAYCPVASDYFGHRNHRYRDMLARGIRVALGTDSILCQPPDEPQPLGILPQARHLWRRDRTDPDLLLRMATVNGTDALRCMPYPNTATLQTSVDAELVAVAFDPEDPTDAWEQVLSNSEPARRL